MDQHITKGSIYIAIGRSGRFDGIQNKDLVFIQYTKFSCVKITVIRIIRPVPVQFRRIFLCAFRDGIPFKLIKTFRIVQECFSV